MASGKINAYYAKPLYLDNSYADKWVEIAHDVSVDTPYTCPHDGLYVLYTKSSSSSAARWRLSAPNETNASTERFFQNKNSYYVSRKFYFKKGTILYTTGTTSNHYVKGYYKLEP